MSNRRYSLPHVGFFQGFEAAARTLSFTKAAEELFITQSAVSRQIKALEDHLGVTLFERRPRALVLTEHGQALYAVAADALDRLQTAVDRLRMDGRTGQLSITTTTGFASLWLIPRLRRFTSLHPEIDVRISATTEMLNLERSLVDLAIRYCPPDAVPEGATRLFGEGVLPVCARSLLRDRSRPLKRPHDLRRHTLLHFDYPGAMRSFMDWGTWLTALGIGELKPAGALHFTQYEQMIQAAVDGQGVALGRQPLVNDLIASGVLVAPFKNAVAGSRAYFLIEQPAARGKVQVRQFAAWLLDEVKRDSESDARR
ncbi:MAG: transcriptional regulator GcvA [Xanthobacteraceae bacterium]|jgi:LysR family transcriptional regulator, glycine cleavage system transcriptional activator